MPIDVRCQCGAAFKVKDEMAGRTGKCPKCGGQITVPTAQAAAIPTLEFAPEPSLAGGAGQTCPGCHTVYDAGILICTRCGIELSTGQYIGGGDGPTPGGAPAADLPPAGRPRRSQPLKTKASASVEEKSFWVALGQIFYNPFEAFEALGYYILTSPLNIGLAAGLYFVGVVFASLWGVLYDRANQEREDATHEAMGYDEEEAHWAKTKRDEEWQGDGYRLRLTVAADTTGRLGVTSGTLTPTAGVRQNENWSVRLRVRGETDWAPAPSAPPVGPGSFAFGLPPGYKDERMIGTVFEDLEPISSGEEVTVDIRVVRTVWTEEGGVEETVAGEHEVDIGFDRSEVQVSEDLVERVGFGFLLVLKVAGNLIGLLLTAFLIEILCRMFTGTGRFLQMAVVLFFLEGVVGIVSLVLVGGSAILPMSVVAYAYFVVRIWSIFLYILAIAKTYEISGITAFVFALMVFVMQWICLPILLAATLLAIFIGTSA